MVDWQLTDLRFYVSRDTTYSVGQVIRNRPAITVPVLLLVDRPTYMGHFGDVLPSQVLKKPNVTQQKQRTQAQNGKDKQKTNLNLMKT